MYWKVCQCSILVFDDGLERGALCPSVETGNVEPFLFFVALGLVTNGSFLASTDRMRHDLMQLS